MTLPIQGRPRGPVKTASGIVFRCTVEGKPQTQGSSRAMVYGGRAIVISANDRLKPWRKAMHNAFQAERARLCAADPLCVEPHLFGGAVVVLSEFILPRLAAHPKTAKGREAAPPVTGLDLDKLCRALHDSLQSSHVYFSDSQIVKIVSSKRYAGLGECPGVVVEVREM